MAVDLFGINVVAQLVDIVLALCSSSRGYRRSAI